MIDPKKTLLGKLLLSIHEFIQKEKSGGLVLGISVIVALVLANSPWQDAYFDFLQNRIALFINGQPFIDLDISHWINDGLMSIFFFVVGLELKKEIVAGELKQPREAILPIIVALGGMLFPALIYISLNPQGEVHHGWGIPMATDIAFALGVLYLLGSRVPVALKVFLTAVAVVDDMGAVLVIALFYTSEISILNLGIGFAILAIMFLANRMGIKNVLFYALLGIGGVWTLFLLSGVHATIAAVLAAFMIPADVRINEEVFTARAKKHLSQFQQADPNHHPTLTKEQLFILQRMSLDNRKAIPTLQRLEYRMQPFVTFVVLPIFALANAGISFRDMTMDILLENHVALGVGLGLLVGKVIGIFGFTWLCAKFNIAALPDGMNNKNLLGLALLGSIGFTMSLFITQLAFVHTEYQIQAKIGIFAASIIGGVLGYLVLRSQGKASNEIDKMAIPGDITNEE